MIWLIGNKGMLSSDIEKLLREQRITYWTSDKEVDIADYKALEEFGEDKKIKWIINCAGHTKVDKAFKINKEGVRILPFPLLKKISD